MRASHANQIQIHQSNKIQIKQSKTPNQKRIHQSNHVRAPQPNRIQVAQSNEVGAPQSKCDHPSLYVAEVKQLQPEFLQRGPQENFDQYQKPSQVR